MRTVGQVTVAWNSKQWLRPRNLCSCMFQVWQGERKYWSPLVTVLALFFRQTAYRINITVQLEKKLTDMQIDRHTDRRTKWINTENFTFTMVINKEPYNFFSNKKVGQMLARYNEWKIIKYSNCLQLLCFCNNKT